MRIALHMSLILLSAWLVQTLLMEEPMKLPTPGLSTAMTLVFMAATTPACIYGALSPLKRWLLLGIFCSAVLAVVVMESPAWHRTVRFPAWQALLVAYAAMAAYALAMARWPTFTSGALRIRDGGDREHLCVSNDRGEIVVFRHGRTICRQGAETRSETRFGGGTSIVPTTGMVTVHGPGGVGYGTVHGTQVISTPVFSYNVSRRTGRTDYVLEEVGPDHALLISKHPRNVRIRARHEAWYRARSTRFTLGAWAAFRFGLWMRFHPKAFFRADRAMPRRISRAASAHLSAMKKIHGRTASHELMLDHELALVSFVALAKDKVFVHLSNPLASLAIGKSDADRYWEHGTIHVPGHPEKIQPGGKIKAALSEWTQLAALRKGRP